MYHPQLGGNWTWRMEEGQFDEKTVERLKRMTWLYERLPEKMKSGIKDRY